MRNVTRATTRTITSTRGRGRAAAGLIAAGLIVAACSGGSSESANTERDAGTESDADNGSDPASSAPSSDAPTADPDDGSAEANTDDRNDDDAPTTGASDAGDTDASADTSASGAAFVDRGPATGPPIVLGMVNTEGTPGLDFPEMRTDTDLAVTYLNDHGGMGGRPVEIEHCASAGSPETSQSCAQELSGKGVEMALLGLDLFPGYDTFAASGIPVVGALPILAPDYTADALFITGGNATTMAAMVALAVEHFDASTVGIISADNPGSNGSETALIGALDKAGLTYKSVKGGDNETDAGFQGLIREANSDDPDLLVSLYSDAGCIGAMRGRVSLGIDTPVVSTAICGSAEVIDVVGDDALGWSFVGVGAPDDTPASTAFAAIIEPAYGDAATASLGLGALGITQLMTLARVANAIVEDGGEVNGQSIYDTLESTTEIRNFPNDNLLACGLSPTYPSVCSFQFPIGEYVEGGSIRTIDGFEAVSVVDYLPSD